MSELWSAFEQEEVVGQLQVASPQELERLVKEVDWLGQQRASRVEALRDGKAQVLLERQSWTNQVIDWVDQHASFMHEILQLELGFSEQALEVLLLVMSVILKWFLGFRNSAHLSHPIPRIGGCVPF